jgi:Arc/MetJ family transcription regulator
VASATVLGTATIGSGQRTADCQTTYMKRTTLNLDEALLEEAKRELGLRTNSATVNAVLKETVRRIHVSHLADFVGKIEWIGDLSEMRGDTPRKRRRIPGRKKRLV